MGVECGSHKRSHSYQTFDPFGQPIFKTDRNDVQQGRWGWKEDQQLLMATHKLKLGNWFFLSRSLIKNSSILLFG